MATPAQQGRPSLESGRGIQNVRALRSDERFTELTNERIDPVNKFQKEEELRNKNVANDTSYEDDFENEEGLNSSTDQIQNRNELRSRRFSSSRKVLKAKPLLHTGTRWIIISIACTSFVFQFLFGILSLGCLYGKNWIDSSLWTSWVNIFLDVSGGLQGAGTLLWGMSALVVFGTFLAFFLWYMALGHNPMHSIMSTFISILLLSCALLPVLNLFPWLVLWVIYLNMNSIFSKR